MTEFECILDEPISSAWPVASDWLETFLHDGGNRWDHRIASAMTADAVTAALAHTNRAAAMVRVATSTTVVSSGRAGHRHLHPRGPGHVGMLSVLAELQRELIVANSDGLIAARALGRRGGRRPRLTAPQSEVAQQLYDGGKHTVQQIADMFGVPRSTVYGHLDKARIGVRAVADAE